jgi:hypothetical protein
MPDDEKRANVIENMEKTETFLNRSGLKVEPRQHSPWSTGHGPCPDPQPLRMHGPPDRFSDQKRD